MASILGVETLQHTNGTTAATIDSSGRILQPAKPAFSAYRNSSGGEGLTGTIVFNATDHNVGNGFSTSTGKFTAPVAGAYNFQVNAFFCGTSGGNLLPADTGQRLEMYKDSTRVGIGYAAFISTTSYPSVSYSLSLNLAVGETVYMSMPSGMFVYSDSNRGYLTFSGFLIG